MKKSELAILVKTIFPDLREWQFKTSDLTVYPRALYWGYVRSAIRASGTAYEKSETVQVSIFSIIPDEPTVGLLEDLMLENGINPEIYVEFNENDKIFHYYTSVNCDRS